MSQHKKTSRFARWGNPLFLFTSGCKQSHLRHVYFTAIIFLLFSVHELYAEEPVLSSDQSIATAGYYQLSWRAPVTDQIRDKSAGYILQESDSPGFAAADTIYKGMDTARVISGKPDGNYFYRIRLDHSGANWSAPIQVTVSHHPLSRAFLFFFIGALVFILIIVAIWRGTASSR